MKVIIETVSHISQRYNTIGDWQWENGNLYIKVSDMGDWRKEFLVGLHEAIETMLCKAAGVTEEEVDAFDLSHPEIHEPGDEETCPYHPMHMRAIGIEEMVMNYLNIDCASYEKVMEDLQNERDAKEKVT